MATGQTEISLIICSHNRDQQLSLGLTSVAQIKTNLAWELIVVGSCPTPETTQAIAQFFVNHPDIHGLHITEPDDGVSRARNAGVKAACGQIIAMIDDDCYAAPDLLDRVCEVFADPRIGFIGGRVLLHDPNDYPITINESTETLRIKPSSAVPAGIMHGANMAFRRTALIGIGGFDEEFGPGGRFPGAGEDWDSMARICANGWAGGYFPGPTVRHHHGRDAAAAAVLLDRYHYGSGTVFMKLVMDGKRTRKIYIKHWVRRTLGDIKGGHGRKLIRQFQGALAYWHE